MARGILALQEIVRTGVTPSLGAGDSANGHYFDNRSQEVYIQVKNGDASPINVTIVTPGTIDGMAIPDLVVVIPATTGDKLIGPFRNDLYGQAEQALSKAVIVDLSADTSVTIGAFVMGDVNY